MVTIGITTFKERFESHFLPLLSQLDGAHAIVAVNASCKDGLDEAYRKQMLQALSQADHVSPIFYQQMRGLAKMWNDLVIHSPTQKIMILNDDVSIRNIGILMDQVQAEPSDMFTINSSWSHFVTSKKSMMDIGWFDERLLGFGEEDGDMVYRHLMKYGSNIKNLNTTHIRDLKSSIRDEGVQSGVSKYTKFNRQFMGFMDGYDYPKYQHHEGGVRGMFHAPMIPNLQNEKQYPYESFYESNKHKL